MFPLSDREKLPGIAVVVLLLVLANAYIFYLELTTPDIELLIERFALMPANFDLINPASWLPLLTSQFLHGGWFHFLTNIWFLVVFGPNVEKVWGSLRFLLFYLLSGVAAGLMQILFSINSDIPVIGASGAIAGVLGAFFVYFPHHRITTFIPLGFIPLFIGIPAGIVLLYWFALQLAGGFFQELSIGGTAFYAHVGGFIAGIILALLNKPRHLIG